MRVTRNMKHCLALGILFQVCQSVEIQAGSIPKPRPRIPFQAVQPGKGVFLVAKQGMLDPRFRRTVVLLVAHGPSGTLGVIVNRATARGLGIADGDKVTIESPTGITRGRAVLREGIRPDTVLMIGQFDHWATPFAKDLGLASLNSVTSLSLSLTDGTGSGADLARVRLSRDTG